MSAIVLALAMTWLNLVPALAHPGSLDSRGGHHDRIHGGYHHHAGTNTGGSRRGSDAPRPDVTIWEILRPVAVLILGPYFLLVMFLGTIHAIGKVVTLARKMG